MDTRPRPAEHFLHLPVSWGQVCGRRANHRAPRISVFADDRPGWIFVWPYELILVDGGRFFRGNISPKDGSSSCHFSKHARWP